MEIKEIVEVVKGMTLTQVSELVKALEEEFGVSAAAPVAVAAAPAAGAAAPAAAEEKSEYTVVLKAYAADKRSETIKTIKEVAGVGLMDAKKIVDEAPATIKENVATEEAKAMKEKLEAAGATIELK